MRRPTNLFQTTRALAAAAIAVTLLAAACSSEDGTTTTESPVESTQPGAETSWGPLAVVPPADGSDGALIQGTLRVTADCVLLEEQGEDVLLVWPANRTIWTPDDATVSFLLGEGQWQTLADGDRITFGGGGSSAAEGGLTSDAWVASIGWVAEPLPSCLTDTRWFIGEFVGFADAD